MSPSRPPRAWLYPRGQWTGRLPSIGGDEFDRCTLVVPLFIRTLVIAIPLWLHHCHDSSNYDNDGDDTQTILDRTPR